MDHDATSVPLRILVLFAATLVTVPLGFCGYRWVQARIDERQIAERLARHIDDQLKRCQRYDNHASCYGSLRTRLQPLADYDPRKRPILDAVDRFWEAEQTAQQEAARRWEAESADARRLPGHDSEQGLRSTP
jgi:hypothetical protein